MSSPRPMVLFITSEMYPFSKTGGLADVLGALPPTLREMGLPVGVITPFYGRLLTRDHPVRLVCPNCHVGYPWPPTSAEIYQADYQGVQVFFISRGEYFDRRYYYNTHQGDYFDNCERFNFFCRAAIEWIRRMDVPPAVVHANDWQAALVPAYIHYLRKADPFWRNVRTLMTIHNLAFQGRFSNRLFFESGLPHEAWHMDGCEYYGDFNLLKSGIAYADMVTTVSPSYAEEILTPEFGAGLEGILKKRGTMVRGILNGADYDVWNPEDDKFLACAYSADKPQGKRECKKRILQEFALDPALVDRPVLGFIGRLRRQKGVDQLIEILPRLLEMDLGVIVLGEGNLDFEAELLQMAEEHQGRLGVRVGYTEDLAHRIQAGSDIFLMPSRYEPCGLTQMYALRYGAVPVATAVGGLKDTITPWPRPDATGFTFAPNGAEGLLEATLQAVRVFEDKPVWEAMRGRAMSADFSWRKSAEKYLEIYRELGAWV